MTVRGSMDLTLKPGARVAYGKGNKAGFMGKGPRKGPPKRGSAKAGNNPKTKFKGPTQKSPVYNEQAGAGKGSIVKKGSGPASGRPTAQMMKYANSQRKGPMRVGV